MFIDQATIQVVAGKGGDGKMSFLRNRHQPRGGPDGGDGGRGGDVVVRASHNSSTLSKYRASQQWKAGDGEAGGGNKRHGKNGASTTLAVPPGTLIKLGEQIVADLTIDGAEVMLARGGRGGLGNTHFASSTHQAPRFAELGEPGDSNEYSLELKLIADVGLVGLPNAGKSTLLSVISSARPKIADYAFTTLEPQLGVASYHEHECVVADIPGIIEGASQGKGLGDTFLRHIERTRVLLIMIDATDPEPVKTYKLLTNELAQYSPKLAARPRIVSISKSALAIDDITDKRKQLAKAARCKQADVLVFSAQEHVGLDSVLRRLFAEVAKAPVETLAVVDNTITDVDIADVMDWYIEKTAEDTYTIKGAAADRWAARTNFDNPAAVERLRYILDRAGMYQKLAQHNVVADTTHLLIGGRELEW